MEKEVAMSEVSEVDVMETATAIVEHVAPAMAPVMALRFISDLNSSFVRRTLRLNNAFPLLVFFFSGDDPLIFYQ